MRERLAMSGNCFSGDRPAVAGSPMNRLLQQAHRSHRPCSCSPPNQPHRGEEPAGATLGAGSGGEGFGWIRPAGGRPWMAGRFRATGCRVENPQSEPGPARRAIDKRPLLRPSLAGRRSVAPRVRPAGSCDAGTRDAEGEPTPEQRRLSHPARRDQHHGQVKFTSILGVQTASACYKVCRAGGSDVTYGSTLSRVSIELI